MAKYIENQKFKKLNIDDLERSDTIKEFFRSVKGSQIDRLEFMKRYTKLPYSGSQSRTDARKPSKASQDYDWLNWEFNFFGHH